MKVLTEGISLNDLPPQVSGELRLYLPRSIDPSILEGLSAELWSEGLISEPIASEARIVAIQVAQESSADIKQRLIQSNMEIIGWQIVSEPPDRIPAGVILAGGLLISALILRGRR